MNNNLPDFFDVIARSDLKEVITPSSPWTYFSMEIGLPNFNFAGGLGILAGDMFLQAGKVNMPFVGVTLFYPIRFKHHLHDFSLKEGSFDNPEQFNFRKETEILLLANEDTVHIDVLCKEMNGVKIIALFEPGLGRLYEDASESQHRLYQEVVLGFGGYIAVRKMGFTPSFIHLNESATVFAAVAFLDDLCSNGIEIDKAIDKVREKTLFTNHTLVPSILAYFNLDYFERYVIKNVKSEAVKNWIRDIFTKGNGTTRLTTLALELAGKLNGVSKMHSKIASERFKKLDGTNAFFTPVTNGIYMQRWVFRNLYRFYRENGVIDAFDFSAHDFNEKIDMLSADELRNIKDEAKEDLLVYLRIRKDHNNKFLNIPPGAKIASWARRFASYKRPTMIFHDTQKLAGMLEEYNIYLLISGDVSNPPEDKRMEVQRALSKIRENKVLDQRVFFLQDYDQSLAKFLVTGSDIWLNTPQVGNEACGTSWEKAVVNLGMLISTSDGGVADDETYSYYRVVGMTYEEEVGSLYKNFEEAASMTHDKNKWADFVKKQLKAFLPIISGGRMMRDYLNLVFS